MVVVEREHEPQLLEPALVGRAQLDGSVRLLPGATEAARAQCRHERSVGARARRVARAASRDPQRERSPGPDRVGDAIRLFASSFRHGIRILPAETDTVNDVSATRVSSAVVSIDPRVDIGHVHLKVADLDRAIAFYRDVLGFELHQRMGTQAVFLSAGGYHHHIGLNTWESRGGSPPAPGTTGLFHVAIRYPDRATLGDALRRLVEAGWPLEGASDHGVSEALYLRDPDDNGVELYRDRAREEWPRDEDGEIAMFTAPLDLQSLLAEAAEASLAVPTSGRAGSARASVGNDRSTRRQSERGDL